MFKVPEIHRIKTGPYSTTGLDGNNGAFQFTLNSQKIYCIASDGSGWEHVSVSLKNRCPTWAEMCAVKAKFWDDEDCVVQYHPPKSQYVNNHSFCLHLWRPNAGQIIAMPPSYLVGIK